MKEVVVDKYEIGKEISYYRTIGRLYMYYNEDEGLAIHSGFGQE